MQLKMYNPELFAAIKYSMITVAAALLGILPELFGRISMDGFIATLQPFSYMVTIFAGFMAIRHWYYATKKINNKNDGKNN